MRLTETSCRAMYLPLPECYHCVVVTIFAATFAKRWQPAEAILSQSAIEATRSYVFYSPLLFRACTHSRICAALPPFAGSARQFDDVTKGIIRNSSHFLYGSTPEAANNYAIRCLPGLCKRVSTLCKWVFHYSHNYYVNYRIIMQLLIVNLNEWYTSR